MQLHEPLNPNSTTHTPPDLGHRPCTHEAKNYRNGLATGLNGLALNRGDCNSG